jgi:mRNA interferase RelE/StbE
VWRIEYSGSSLRALRKMPRNIAQTIEKKIEALAEDPYAPNNNVKKLQGRPGFRLRVGDWRVLYELDMDRIVILEIGPRGGMYR